MLKDGQSYDSPKECANSPLFEAYRVGAYFAVKGEPKDKVFSTCGLLKTSVFFILLQKDIIFALVCLKLKGKWSKRIILKFNSKKTTWHCGLEASKRGAFIECVGNGAGLEFKETGCSTLEKKSPPVRFAYLEKKNRLKSFL